MLPALVVSIAIRAEFWRPLTNKEKQNGDLIETYKIITGKEKIKKEDFFDFSDTGYNLRGHCYKLSTQRSHLEVRQNFFSQRVVGPWNQLPAHVVEAPSVNAFKNRYDKMKSGAR